MRRSAAGYTAVMTMKIQKDVPCPVCGRLVPVTCHAVPRAGSDTAHDVVFDSAAPCPGSGQEGHGPVTDSDWIGPWSLAPTPARQPARQRIPD